MRCFIAIDIPDKIKEFIGKLVKIPSSLEGVNIVQPKNYHITVKFLGEVSESLIPEIKSLLNKIATHSTPFELVVSAPGVFPDEKNPRVVWIGTNSSIELRSLAKKVEEELEKIGFEREKRDFKSHITLARVKNTRNGKYFYEKVVRNYQLAIKNIGIDYLKFRVDSVVLMKSTLTGAGSIYDIVESFSLLKNNEV